MWKELGKKNVKVFDDEEERRKKKKEQEESEEAPEEEEKPGFFSRLRGQLAADVATEQAQKLKKRYGR